jgi:RNA 2',3'-cyclic 3'-phosphodiesterase
MAMDLNKLRLFVGVAVPPLQPLMQTVEAGRKGLLAVPDVRWVPPANWHITLVYIGMVEGYRMPGLVDVLTSSLVGKYSFEVTLKGIGAFPSIEKPTVIWAGVANSIGLDDVQHVVLEALVREGFCFATISGFVPHVTLAKSKRAMHGMSINAWREQYSSLVFGRIGVAEVVLYLSESTPHGMVYNPLHHFALLNGLFFDQFQYQS